MTIKKVKIHENEGDQTQGDLRLCYSGRAIELQTSKTSHDGPWRCATTKEYSSLIAAAPQKSEIPDFISIIPRKLSQKELNLFVTSNGTHKEVADYLISKSASARHASIITAPILLSKTVKLEPKYYEIFSRASDFIQGSVADSLGTSKNLFSKTTLLTSDMTVSQIESIFRSQSKIDTWMPVVPMGMNENGFKRTIDLVKEQEGTYHVPMIMLVHEDPLKYLMNYDYLWRQRNSEIAITMCDAPREDDGYNYLSTPHYLHLFGIDFIGRRVEHVGGSSKKSNGEKGPSYLDVKYFNKKELTIQKEMNASDALKILEEMPVDPSIKKMYENRKQAESEKDVNVLKSISNIHEYYASTNELSEATKYIKKREYRTYLEDKNKLKSLVNRFGVQRRGRPF